MKNTEAFLLFEKGRFTDALKASVIAINNKESAINETPYEQCKLVLATWMNFTGRKREAYEEVIGLMRLGLDSTEIRDTLLLIMGERSDARDIPFIFGLGTGRSGSTSLTTALSSIPNSYFSHEHPSIIPWKNGEAIVEWHLLRLRSLAHKYSAVGDVSHWWLPYVEDIYKAHVNSFFVVMKRSRRDTVSSFLKIKGGGGRGSINNWIEHDGEYFVPNIWDRCYPKYAGASSLVEALEQYWDDYYASASRLQKLLPKNVLIVDLEDKNKEALLKSFIIQNAGVALDSISFEKQNIGSSSDGINYFPTPDLSRESV